MGTSHFFIAACQLISTVNSPEVLSTDKTIRPVTGSTSKL